MAPSKARQRALARAKVERQIARRAASARRRRQLQAAVGAGLAVVLVLVGVAWATGAFKSHKKAPVAAGDCAWTTIAASDKVKDVGTPPKSNIPRTGTPTMTITTNRGVITADLDASGAPCAVASFTYLAGKQFFNNTKCHRLTTDGIYVLQCGDPSGTGTGGPAYKFPDENLPAPTTDPSASPSAAPPTNLYPAGTLAMANSGPNTNGSQFFVVYKDNSALEAKYTIFGKITQGLELVQSIAAAGVTPGTSATDGAPKQDVTIQSLTVTAPAAAVPSPSASPSSTS